MITAVIPLGLLKFKLSTLLLAVTCIALATGLYFERRANALRTERIINGAVAWQNCLRLNVLETADPVGLASRIERDQIRQVLTLFRSVDEIEQFNEFISRQQIIERSYADAGIKWPVKQSGPTNLASGILNVLGYSSTDEYFEQFSKTFGNEIFIEFQLGGDRHSEFRAFLEQSFETSK